MRLLLLADLHLGARLPEWGARAPGRREDLLRAWNEAVNLALAPAREIGAVLVAGDLFDQPDPAPELLDAVGAGVQELIETGRPVVLLPGAYDGLAHPGSAYLTGAFPPGAVVVDWTEPRRTAIPVGEELLHLYARAAVPGRNSGDAPQAMRREPADGYHVALVHAYLETAPPEAPSPWGMPVLGRDEVEGWGLDLVVAGGGHRYRERLWGSTLAIQPGSPVGLHADETGDRYFAVADLTPAGSQVAREVREVAPVVEITVALGPDRSAEPQALAARVASQVGEAAYARIRLTGETDHPVDAHLLGRTLSALPAVVEVVDETAPASDWGAFRRLGEENSVRGAFVRGLQERRASARDARERRVIERALLAAAAEFHRLEVRRVD